VSSTTELPINDINFVIVTDVHSWVAGHGFHEPSLNADYGDVLSFYEHLAVECNSQNKDLFFVMNGDFVDGTGLSQDPPSDLVKILEKMPWDAINVGNHELYMKSTVDFISKSGGFIDFWDGRYVTSNVVLAEGDSIVEHNDPTQEGLFLGKPYIFLKGKNTGKTILTFGFLYDMKNNDPSVTVEAVEDVMHSIWFTEVITGMRGDFDAILVLAHMDVHDPLIDTILSNIRVQASFNVPVLFVTGHTHHRGFESLDDKAISVESGRYLDTVGFVSFTAETNNPEFEYKFLDANYKTLSNAVGFTEENDPSFVTPNGQDLSALIIKTQNDLGLLETIGCSPQTYDLKSPREFSNSIWSLFLDRIVPNYLFENDESKVLILNDQDFRYSLFEGEIRVTDLISVSPFSHDKFMRIGEHVQGRYIKLMIDALNDHSTVGIDTGVVAYASYGWPLPNYMASTKDLDPDAFYEVFSGDFHKDALRNELEKVAQNSTGTVNAPHLLPEVYSNKSSRDLWEAFIKENFVCRGNKYTGTNENDSNFAREARTKKVKIFLAVLLLGGGSLLFIFVALKALHKKYGSVITDTREGVLEDLDHVFDGTVNSPRNVV